MTEEGPPKILRQNGRSPDNGPFNDEIYFRD